MPADLPAGERPTGTLEPRLPGLAHPNRVLITAGPTHEPIDAVRFLGNRSSGRMGIEIAQAFARTGEGEPNTTGRAGSDKGKERPTGRPERPEPAKAREVRLLLGPTSLTPTDTRVQVLRFQSTAELQALLGQQFSWCDVLVMAAAVADFRPKGGPLGTGQKLRRDPTGLTLALEPTPDLLAEVAQRRRSDQLLVGFALEPRDRLIMSAREKLARKKLDLIVANELETMESPDVWATVLDRRGGTWQTPGKLDKRAFAELLVERLDEAWRALQSVA